jgi:hypothetical protein
MRIGSGEVAGTGGIIENLIGQAKRAETNGFASEWFANIFGMDAILAAVICDRETSRIELGGGWGATYLGFGRHHTSKGWYDWRRVRSRSTIVAADRCAARLASASDTSVSGPARSSRRPPRRR